ncbi:MAG: RNA 2'-phosphotransferase [Candidatus Bathyarchaeia archaeon]
MSDELRVKVSRYMSYLLRHNPQGLGMDEHGFVDLDKLLEKINQRFKVDKFFVLDVVEKSGRKRFEVVGNKIRALYGHTVPVKLEFEEDKTVKVLYHGTTPHAASKILREGLKPMKRKWVHLSPTIEVAMEVGMRRTDTPTVLEIDAEAARRDGLKFFKATDKVYLCKNVPQKYVTLVRADAYAAKH